MSPAPFLCLSFPDLALQAYRHRLGWSEREASDEPPLLIVAADRPGAAVRECNDAARKYGISPGMSYSQALGLCTAVHATPLDPAERSAALEEIRGILANFCPAVEQSQMDDAVLWGTLQGLDRLGGGTVSWVARLAAELAGKGWAAGVAVGWTRPGTCLAAHRAAAHRAVVPGATVTVHPPGVVVQRFSTIVGWWFQDRDQEIQWYRRCPLDLSLIPRRDQERLTLLGISRVSDLLALNERALTNRFSPRIRRLHHFLKGQGDVIPVQGTAVPQETQEWSRRYEPPLRSTTAVVDACISVIETMLPSITEEGRWLRGIILRFTDDRAFTYTEEITSGILTRSSGYLQRLVVLRMEHKRWQAREIVVVTVTPITERARIFQQTLEGLWNERGTTPFDQRTMAGAITLLQARLGNEHVFMVQLRPGRIPEHRFSREPLPLPYTVPVVSETAEPSSDGAVAVHRIRRILSRSSRIRYRTPPPFCYGPFLLASEWWESSEVGERVYTYHRTPSGILLWMYRLSGARTRTGSGGWVLQGTVE